MPAIKKVKIVPYTLVLRAMPFREGTHLCLPNFPSFSATNTL